MNKTDLKGNCKKINVLLDAFFFYIRWIRTTDDCARSRAAEERSHRCI